MIRFFKSFQPAAIFVVPFIVLVLWAQAFFKQPFVVEETGMPLWVVFTGFLSVLPGFFKVLLAMSLISLEAIYLNNLLNRHEVLSKSSYLPTLMYALVMSLSVAVLQFHPLILVNLILLGALDKLFMLFKNDAPISPLFDSCFLIAIASLIYLPAASMFILFLTALAILRPFSFREWIISLIGFFLPYFFLGIYFFWTDQSVIAWSTLLRNYVAGTASFGFVIDQPLLILFSLLSLLFLLAVRRVIQNLHKNTVRTRSNQQILLLFFLITVLSSLLLKTIPLYHLTMLAIPLAVFYGYYFLEVKKRPWFSEMLFWLLIGVILWNHF